MPRISYNKSNLLVIQKFDIPVKRWLLLLNHENEVNREFRLRF